MTDPIQSPELCAGRQKQSHRWDGRLARLSDNHRIRPTTHLEFVENATVTFRRRSIL